MYVSACKFTNKREKKQGKESFSFAVHTLIRIFVVDMKERNHTFDLLCGICMLGFIVAIVTDHCKMNDAAWATEMRWWTYLAVGLFYFKAGYYCPPADEPLMPLLQRKARRLLVPYVVWSMVGMVLYFAFLHFFPEALHDYRESISWRQAWETGQWYGNPVLWVLPSLFLSSVIGMGLVRLHGASIAAVLLPAVSWWLASVGNPLWLGLGNVFVGTFLYVLGHWWAWAERRLEPTIFMLLSTALVFAALTSNWLLYGEYTMAENLWTGCAPASIANASLALCGLTGMLHSVITRPIPMLGFVGRHSMTFLVLPYPMITYYNFVHLIGKRTMTGHWNDFIAASLLTICLCSWLAKTTSAKPKP